MNALEKAVKEIIEENGGQEFAEQVVRYGCSSGIVSELIYNKDTHAWFDTHYEDIMELVEEYEDATGEKLEMQTDLKTWLAWFSFEQVAYKMYE